MVQDTLKEEEKKSSNKVLQKSSLISKIDSLIDLLSDTETKNDILIDPPNHQRVVLSKEDPNLSLVRVGTDKGLHSQFYQISQQLAQETGGKEEEWVESTEEANYRGRCILAVDFVKGSSFLGDWLILYEKKLVGIYEFIFPQPEDEGYVEANIFLLKAGRDQRGIGTKVHKTVFKQIVDPELGKEIPIAVIKESAPSDFNDLTPNDFIWTQSPFRGLKGEIANTNYASLIAATRAGWALSEFSGQRTHSLFHYPLRIDVKEDEAFQKAKTAIDLLLSAETRPQGIKELQALYQGPSVTF